MSLKVYAREEITFGKHEGLCCNGAHAGAKIVQGTPGRANKRSPDFYACVVKFKGYPHSVLCMRDMLWAEREYQAWQEKQQKQLTLWK